MNIQKKDIEEFIESNIDIYKDSESNLYQDLYDLYNITSNQENEKYVIKNIAYYCLQDEIEKQKIYNRRRKQLQKLKKLKLPDQRSP